jgi:molecular chaperone DnaK
MRKDAEAHAEDDLKRKELIEARNNADNTAYAAEKALKEFGDKVPEDVKTEIEAKVGEVRKAAEGEDVEAMKAVTGILNEAIQKIGASVYEQEPPVGTSQPGAEGEATEGEADPNPDDEPDVVEGEVNE